MQDGNMTQKKKKIGFFITAGVWGGAQKYVYNLATSLPEEKYDVFVVMGNGNILKEKLELKSIRTYSIGHLKRDVSILSEIKTLWHLLKITLKEKPDVLHLNSPKASGLGSFVGKVLFVPKIIQTVHGFTWNEERGPVSKTLIVFFTWLTMIFSHKIIVLSKREERQARTLPFVKNKIVLIPNGIEKIEFLEKMIARKELLAKIGGEARDNSFIIGSIAELHKNKGLEYAIQAVSKIKQEFLYFIIGGGEEKDKLEKLIKEKGLENKVFLLGFIHNANEYMRAFNVFLLSSVKEGLPYVILEAGQASLPVVASAIAAIPEVVKNNECGILVTPKKPGEITQALEYLMENPDKTKTFGENLYKTVQEKFSIGHMLEKTLELYE